MLFEWDNGKQWEFSSPLGIIATCLLDGRRKLQGDGGRRKRILGQLSEGCTTGIKGPGFLGSEAVRLCVIK